MIIYRVYEYMDFHALFLNKADVASFLKSLPCVKGLKVEKYDTDNKVDGEMVPNFVAPAANWLEMVD